MKMTRRASILTTGALLALASTAVLAQQKGTIVVGGKNFTEQQIMSAMTAELLRAKGYNVDVKAGMGSAVLRQAQESGQIDVYWEYTGTSLITYNKITDKLSPTENYNKVKELDAKKGLVWLNPSKANNTFSLAMNADEAKKHGISTISDLAKKVKDGAKLTLASNAEFYARPDGLKPLEQTYGFEFPREAVKRMDTGLVYQALKEKQVDVGLVFATDGRIPAFNFVVLKDDKGYFPAYAMTPVVRKQVLDANPKLDDILNS
ncbi:MAG: glycine betaine ABC transporter substrate-binding protein, partial [Burkholderiaceae bacterium]